MEDLEEEQGDGDDRVEEAPAPGVALLATRASMAWGVRRSDWSCRRRSRTGKMRGGMGGSFRWLSGAFPPARVPGGPSMLKMLQLVHWSEFALFFMAFGLSPFPSGMSPFPSLFPP